MELKKVDLREIPLPDASVDVTVCSEVLEHIPDHLRASSELTRVLAPGGVMLFSMPNAFSLFYLKVRMKKNHRKILERIRRAGKTVFDPPEASGLAMIEWEMVRHISFPFWDIEKIATAYGLTIVSRRGANIIPLPYVLRKFFIRRFPLGLRVWTMTDRSLGYLFPFLGSFYFLTLKK